LRRTWVKWIGLVILVGGTIAGAAVFLLAGIMVNNALAAGTHGQPAPTSEFRWFAFFGAFCGAIPGALLLIVYWSSKPPP
jgi:hypothetical protein